MTIVEVAARVRKIFESGKKAPLIQDWKDEANRAGYAKDPIGYADVEQYIIHGNSSLAEEQNEDEKANENLAQPELGLRALKMALSDTDWGSATNKVHDVPGLLDFFRTTCQTKRSFRDFSGNDKRKFCMAERIYGKYHA